ncbi:MAG: histidine--tRNA ligase [Clostridia bacterium]|nr:histidine--tRNA ligase [Clostridia bacterium]
MALLTKAPRGTQDTLPSESYKLRQLENILSGTASTFGFREIRTPVFEHTELFCRGMGDTTDVVQKEMYTFNDNGNRSISLRPEGTAGTVRAFLEHGLFNEPLPQKYFYHTSCYRYEKPQAGRLREFHQFGVENLGSGSPAADAEIIALALHIFDFFELDGIRLEINSIGCPECRKNYHAALISYFNEKKADLCETCLSRLERNPMRILDCKSPVCSEIAKSAPVVLDFLCDECETHFTAVKKYLDAMDIDYRVNPRIVRGLDYYTKTVFEFVSDSIGAQGTVCGGGRYDGLIKELGGNALPACGFGMGMERLCLLLEAQRKSLPEEPRINLYIAPASPEYSYEAMRLVNDLRYEGISALTDLGDRSLKAQMKYANKKNVQFTAVLGEDEINNRTLNVKNMDNGEVTPVSIDGFTEGFMHLSISAALGADMDLMKNLTLIDGGKQ